MELFYCRVFFFQPDENNLTFSEKEMKVQVCIAEVDLSDYENIYDKIAERIEGKEIGILSNDIKTLFNNKYLCIIG